ncbi:hypothetical protein A1O3_01676 [Capronia epimyces CBS 606.96]|uniref:Uncharacterized protein n=1 Tax=Capronia epimyces CBS 606.96 TaxID=1182542 RepID=W9ZF37_9EURO|nr:uncharacterized protein A1O3_01676 [Capronia epimyces CBS 606.96]EXJ93119.1 hypothetical protein A1O3_01676 [Capronia epimyces CBS 606.96]
MDELLYPPVRFPCLSEGLGQRQHSHSGSGSSRSQSQPQEQSQDQDQDQDQDESDKSQPKEPKEQTAQPSPCEDDDNDDDKTNTRLYSLREQIELSYARLEKLVDTLRNHNHNCKDGLSTAKAASTGPGDGTAALETGEQEQEREREQDQEQDQEQQREQEPGRDPTQGQVPEPQPLVNVVLVGHSVGAYIALEIVRLRHERHGFRQSSSSTTSSSSASNRANSTSGINISSTSTDTTRTGQSSTSSPPAASVNASWTVTACILLTPTIVDIHRSPSGRVATPLLTSLQLALPSASASRFILPVLAHTLVHSVLVKSLPSTWLSWLVERVAGMKRGSHGSDATLAFLRSPRGVKQALYMAADEMGQIRADGWGEEVWGAAAVDNDIGGATRFSPTPRLYFWFAKSDHWVADITREEIQRARGGGVVERDEIDILGHATDEVQFRLDATNHDKHAVDEAPMVRIYETDGLAHAWCLNQSEFVARRVIGWLREILGQECRESV